MFLAALADEFVKPSARLRRTYNLIANTLLYINTIPTTFTLNFIQFIILQHTTKWLCEWVDEINLRQRPFWRYGDFCELWKQLRKYVGPIHVLNTKIVRTIHHLVFPSRFSWRFPRTWPLKQDFVGVPQDFWQAISSVRRSLPVTGCLHVCGDKQFRGGINSPTNRL